MKDTLILKEVQDWSGKGLNRTKDSFRTWRLRSIEAQFEYHWAPKKSRSELEMTLYDDYLGLSLESKYTYQMHL